MPTTSLLPWLLPALLVFYRPSVWTGVALLCLLVTATRWVRRHRSSADDLGGARAMFALLPQPPRKQLQASVLAAALLQLGVWVGATGSRAEALIYLTTAMVWLAWRWPERAGPLSRREAALRIGFAALLLIGALLPRHLGRGGSSTASASVATHHAPPPPPAAEDEEPPPPIRVPGAPDDSFQAVVLWPEELPKTILVAPLPAVSRTLLHRPQQQKLAEPLTIPFYGVYWFLRPPHRSPPRSAFVTRGKPTETGFRSINRWPLTMEAHQNLGSHFPVNCCSRIRIAVANADKFPSTVNVELILRDSTLEHGYAMSLGRQPVNSTLPWRPGQPDQAQPEVLEFAMPQTPALKMFDEFTVRYHLDGMRHEVSARIAIERFVLVPYGR